MTYVFLLLAIVAEVIATSALKASDAFTRLTPSLVTVGFYCIAFYLLSLTLRTMSVGVAYALWSAFGIVLVSIVGVVLFKQSLDLPAILGLGLIISGVVVINVFSSSVGH